MVVLMDLEETTMEVMVTMEDMVTMEVVVLERLNLKRKNRCRLSMFPTYLFLLMKRLWLTCFLIVL